jgi:hypothetical protein
MSAPFSVKASDLAGPNIEIPNGEYLGEVESCVVQTRDNGVQLYAQIGSLTNTEGGGDVKLPAGGTFTIGARKVFWRAWYDHTNEQAASIGHRQIIDACIGNGFVTPTKGADVSFPFANADEFATAFAGKRVRFRTKQKKQTDKQPDGTRTPHIDPETGEQAVRVEIVAWLKV